MLLPRDWQKAALTEYRTANKIFFLADVTPGAGKTMFSAFVATYLFEAKLIDFVVIVVPTTELKGTASAGFMGDWKRAGIEITTVLKEKRSWPKEFRGGVVTYQQLPNMVGSFEVWKRNGLRILAIFDELHHASTNNIWGAATEALGRASIRTLGMTGTAFRGDNNKISFVEYDASGRSKADFVYSYREAVRDYVCREVEFVTDDSIAEFMLDNAQNEVRVSQVVKDDDIRGATNTVFRTDHGFLAKVLEKADDNLEQYRSWDIDAGGLVVCRAGKDAEDASRHVQRTADLLEKTLGDIPEVVYFEDQDAGSKIERFRTSKQKWICAVRMITEGVDIKRLRVLVMATRPTTELLFRQIVGRVVRVDNEQRPGTATVYIAKFPQLVEWAARIAEEAEAGVKQRKPRNGGEKGDPRPFMALRASHEDAGIISDYGDEYTVDEVNAAELLRGNDPQLVDISIAKLAYLQRKLGIVPEPMTAPDLPLQIKKKEIRRNIVKHARHLAIVRNREEPDFKFVWREIAGTFGPKTADDMIDNYSIDIMRQIEQWLIMTLSKNS